MMRLQMLFVKNITIEVLIKMTLIRGCRSLSTILHHVLY
jgi:hypothetical protein